MPPVVHNHAAHHVRCSAASLSRIPADFVYPSEVHLGLQQAKQSADCSPVKVHVNISVLETNCVDLRQLKEPLVLHFERVLAVAALFAFFSVLYSKVTVTLDDCLENIVNVFLIRW